MTRLQCAISLMQKRMCSLGPVPIEDRRNYLLADALKEAGKKKFDVMKKLKVSQTVCVFACVCFATFKEVVQVLN